MLRKVVHLTSVHYAFDTRIYHKECKSLACAGYEVTLIAPHAASDHVEGGVRLRGINPPRNRMERMTTTVAAVHSAALRENPDICHIHDPELIPIGLLLKLQGKRVIYDVHEDYAGNMRDKWIPNALCGCASAAVNMCEAMIARSCDRILAASPSIAQKFPSAQTRLVRNFPWVDELRGSPTIPYEQRGPLVAYVGSLGNVKGLREMTRAVELAATAVPIRLVVVGRVVSGARAANRSSRLVSYLGFLTRPQVADVLARARIGIATLHPNGNYEKSFPTKLFEYMSAGLPVVCSDFPACREVIKSSHCGLLVDPLSPCDIAFALAWLLTHPSEADQMGRNGRQAVAEKYNWEGEAESLVSAYAELQSTA